MSVVQMSERASMELLGYFVQGTGIDGTTVKGSVSEDPFLVPDISVPPKDLPVPPITKSNKRWNTSNKYLRPRIFCLEHTVQIEEMMRSKGGANILVICHSDYQKIKAHAAAVAEEISSPFNYIDFPLVAASEEYLHLIDLAIDDGEHDECREDWTSKLGINLQHCVKIRKNSPSKQVQHALPLGDLFSEKSPSSDFSKIKWQLRRSRSKIKLNHPAHSRPGQSIEMKIGERMGEELDGIVIKNEEKLIQYSRRKFKLKPDLSTGARPRKLLPDEISVATSDNLNEHNRNNSEINNDNIANSGSISAESVLSPNGMSEGLHEVQVLEATSNVSLNYSPSRVADSLATATLVVDSIEQTETETRRELNIEGTMCYIAASTSAEMQQNTNDTDVISEKIEISYAGKCSSHHSVAVDNEFDKQRVDLQSLANSASPNVACPPVGSLNAQIEDFTVDNSCINSEVCDHTTYDNEVRQDLRGNNENDNEEPISCDDKLTDQPSALTGEWFEDVGGMCTAEDFCNGLPLPANIQHESNIGNDTNEELISSSVPLQSSEVQSKECAAAHLCCVRTKEEIILSSVTLMEVDQPSVLLAEGCSEVPRGICVEEDLGADVTLDCGMLLENQTTGTNMDKLISGSSLQLEENQPVPASTGVCSEVPSRICAEENLNVGSTTDNELQEQAQTTNAINEDQRPSSLASINQSAPALIRKSSRTQKESYSAENLCNDNEACSSKDKREMECSGSTVEDTSSSAIKGRKRKRELEQITENKCDGSEFIRSPCEGLRSRAGKNAADRSEVDVRKMAKEKLAIKTLEKPSNVSVPCQDKKKTSKGYQRCDLDGCRMSFKTKRELSLHKNNRCPHEGCGKRFSSHKYAIIHQRVHIDERPLKCPWKGCSMSFKWAWARTEHIRVHTGERPYQCKFEGCGLSFRFVSDISRHRRKTGHYENLSS